MHKFKYHIVILSVFLCAHYAYALDIQYGTITAIKKTTVTVQYYGIGEKQIATCSLISYKCTITQRQQVHIAPSRIPKKVKKIKKKSAANQQNTHFIISPSGRYSLSYIGATDITHTRKYRLRNIRTKTETEITRAVNYWDLVDNQGKVFAFTPDSSALVYLDDTDGALSLYHSLTNASIQTATKLKTSAGQIDDFIFTDSSTLYYLGNTKENPYDWILYRYNLKTNTDEIVAHHVSYSDPLRIVGMSLIFSQLQEKGYGPAVYNLRTKKIQKFTIPGINTNTPSINDEVVSRDNLHGVIMAHQDTTTTQSRPLLIWLHGGPYRETSLEYHPFHSYGIYDAILQTLEKNDAIIFKLDYPGSLGYGRNYAESLKESVGTADVASVMNAITYMKNRYKTSAVYIAGNSYGGYLALRTIVEYPDAANGVISINGVTDWESLLVRIKHSIFNTEFNGLPNANNRSLYDQASILSRINNVNDQRIQIIQGQADKTIPPWQAELLYQKLVAQNKNATIIRYPNEDHVFKEKDTITNLCAQMFTFIGLRVDSECTQ